MEPYKKGQNLLEDFVWPIDTGRLMGVPIDLTRSYRIPLKQGMHLPPVFFAVSGSISALHLRHGTFWIISID